MESGGHFPSWLKLKEKSDIIQAHMRRWNSHRRDHGSLLRKYIMSASIFSGLTLKIFKSSKDHWEKNLSSCLLIRQEASCFMNNSPKGFYKSSRWHMSKTPDDASLILKVLEEVSCWTHVSMQRPRVRDLRVHVSFSKWVDFLNWNFSDEC